MYAHLREEGIVAIRRYQVKESPRDFLCRAHVAQFKNNDLPVDVYEILDELSLRRKEDPVVKTIPFIVMAIRDGDDPNQTMVDVREKDTGRFAVITADSLVATYEMIVS